MRKVYFILAACLFWGAAAHAEDQKLRVDDVVMQMVKELDLTDEQGKAVKPIIKESMTERRDFLESLQQEAVISKETIKNTMLRIRREENEQLSKILSEEQMKKRIAKQRLKDSLNPDQMSYTPSSEEAVIMTPQGGALQF